MNSNDFEIEDNVLGSRGFVTIATGAQKYYQMALNLLHSYRVNGESSLPFALICDKECNETQEFDDVIIIERPNNSYLDKLALHKYAPYEETIFIDADALILSSVEKIWDDFASLGDFSCYGKVLPLDSQKGWFFYDGMGDLKDKLNYGINMHGGIYYLRKTSTCYQLFENANAFARNYHSYAFAQFQNPADEPVIALSMVLANSKPCDRKDRILFLPSVDGKLHVTADGTLKLNGKVCNVPVLHFANINITRYLYQYLVLSVDNNSSGIGRHPNIKERLYLYMKCFFPECKAMARRLLKRILPRNAVVFLKRVIDK